MKKFAILTDSCCDLTKDLRDKYDIDYTSMHYSFDEKDYVADLDWTARSPKEFYDLMRQGVRIKSSAVNSAAYVELFEKYLSQGMDILSISTTSALSNSVRASFTARDQLLEKYPQAKIICIDSCCACTGLGILCIKASMMREEGKTIEEAAGWVKENAKYINQEGTVDKLTWLKQAGRVSALSAFFGGLLNIKPLIISDIHGYNVAVEKVKGRKASIVRVAERVADEYVANDFGIFINHADCLGDAIDLRNEIMARLDVKQEDFHMGYIGPAIGASVGPGMMGVYFYGKEVTLDSKAKEE
ncbi:MAG: DegV family protein [Clostridia bacterium]|nr:DegV family protein [Clostridia bacterium]